MKKEVIRCIYCKGPAYLTNEGSKYFLDCKKCGRRETTEKLVKKLRKESKKR